ncbi:Subtilisin-like protease [Morella rubra]|uniref:Subtilisin-like protease n=1 Tax=Morella rubra TaxID=262757 RepID=A0A6A1WF33_9ROSI|nr:Subtilisin-like protease [Morella rubra]
MRTTYIVHMDKSLMPKPFLSQENWYESIVYSLKFTNSHFVNGHGSPPSLIYKYNNALHGFSVDLSPEELKSLKKVSGFISAYRDNKIILDTTLTPEFLSLSPISGLLKASNSGRDIIIGILDSGIWPESPSFKNDGISSEVPSKWKGSCDGGKDFNFSMCNGKIIGARYFNRGLKRNLRGSMSSPDSARDDTGHGTVVSAIAAGNYVEGASFDGYAEGIARGVAPFARLAVYKVAWKEGTYESDIINGIDQAIADGVDVINMSFGKIPREKIYEDAVAIASFAAVEKGIVVSTSGGNEGSAYRKVKNGFPWVLTVTAGTIDRQIGGTLVMGNGLSITGQSMYSKGNTLDNMRLVYEESLSTCSSPALLNRAPEGIIVCDIGNIEHQIKSLGNANLKAAILICGDPSILRLIKISYPYIVIRPEDANSLIMYAKYDDEPSASIQFKQTFIGVKHSPTVGSYASRGPSLYFPNILKPDIMAPGTLILAASIPNNTTIHRASNKLVSDTYIFGTGSSFACPHVAGVTALLRKAHPEWSVAAIMSAIITTANAVDNTLQPILEYDNGFKMASPLSMGAGHIDPNKALDPGLIYDATPQDYLNHLCSFTSYKLHIKEITRSKNYTCSNPSPDLNLPSILSSYTIDTIMRPVKFQRIVTNVGEGFATYKCNVTEPLGFQVSVVPRRLLFGRKYEKQTYTLTLTSTGLMSHLSFGQIIWVEENGKHLVKSPIVIYFEEFL